MLRLLWGLFTTSFPASSPVPNQKDTAALPGRNAALNTHLQNRQTLLFPIQVI